MQAAARKPGCIAAKALKGFGGYAGGSAQAWVLAIVRNCCLTMLEARKADGKVVVLQHAMDASLIERLPAPDIASQADNRLVVEEERLRVRAAIAALPVQLREVVVLREFHDHSYREIADIVGAPIGTVMSRLARARERLAGALREQDSTENGRKA